MKIRKAVITAAGANQRTLPLQTLVDRDGRTKSVLTIVIEEALKAGVEEIGLIVHPGDEDRYLAVADEYANRLHVTAQSDPRGHGHAILCGRTFVQDEPFLHLVGDHLYVHRGGHGCAEQLVALAETQSCSVSAVQATRESLLPYYGAVGGRCVAGQDELYHVEKVLEKPSPTLAEQELMVPGLRAGHYLCFFGMHVLTKSVMEILEQLVKEDGPDVVASGRQGEATVTKKLVTLSAALDRLSQSEQYLAVEQQGTRYDVGVKYGLLNAQLALAIHGQDREEVLSGLLTLLTQRELNQDQWRQHLLEPAALEAGHEGRRIPR